MGEALKGDVGLPYRAGASATIPPLSILYAPFSFFVLLRPVFLLVASVWITFGLLREGALAARVLEGGGLILAGVGYLAYSLPLVRIHAQIDGGQVVLRGCRWPGAETHWTCAIQEAQQFEVETVDVEEGLPTAQGRFYRLALRTADGTLLPITEKAYRGMTFIHTKPLNRLNAWLADVRTG